MSPYIYVLSGWDDDCSGLVETLVREAEWKDREAHNDAEAACWESEAPDGWGNTPPVSPVYEGWPGDNPNTTQTLEYTKDKYNAKIRK
jgi:hypothetical protein